MDLKSKIILVSGPTASGKSKFAIKLSKLIKSRNLREKMGKESHKIALSKFSSKIINSETLKLYDELFFEIHS